MPSCELCGEETGSLTKVKIEGAKLKVCDSCSSMGTEVETKKKKSKKRKKKKRRSRQGQKTLVNNYGQKVKKAREDEEISIKELADDLNEKSSLISKIEQEKLKPDNTLAQKLSERFNIELYTNPEVTDYDDTKDADSRKATIGDVADLD